MESILNSLVISMKLCIAKNRSKIEDDPSFRMGLLAESCTLVEVQEYLDRTGNAWFVRCSEVFGKGVRVIADGEALCNDWERFEADDYVKRLRCKQRGWK